MEKRKSLGIACAIAAAVIYGFTPILGKITYMEGSNTITLTFFRSFFSFPVLFLMLRLKGEQIRVSKRDLGTLIILGFLGAFATGLMLYGAYNYISVGLTTCMHNIYPVLVAVGSIVLFKDRVSRSKLLALALALAGLWTILAGDMTLNLFGVALALGSGVAYAAYLLIMDKSGMNRLNPFLISFYMCAVASTFLFLFGTATGELVYSLSPKGWFFTFLMAMFVSVLANSLIPMAVKNVGPTVTSILGMFEPVVALIMGILFLGESLTFRSGIGCVLVIGAVIILTLEKEAGKAEAPAEAETEAARSASEEMELKAHQANPAEADSKAPPVNPAEPDSDVQADSARD